MPREQKIIQGIEKYFLIGILLLLIMGVFGFVAPFIGTLFMAAIVAVAVDPVKKRIHAAVKSPTFATLLTLLLAVVIIYGVLAWLFFAVINQASDAYRAIDIQVDRLIQSDHDYLAPLERFPRAREWAEKALQNTPISINDVATAAGDLVGGISTFILGQAKNLLKQLSVILLHTVIFILSLFYFLKDGRPLIRYVKNVVPLSEKYRLELFKKIHRLIRAIMFGLFGTAVLQGVLVGLGLGIVGVSNPAFWGAVAALLSPIPYLGTTIIWLPVALYLFMSGHWQLGLFLSIWGAVVVGTSDNIVKPYLIGSGTSLHPLAVMTVILGGAFAFGFKGIIFGPFVLMLALAFLHIYELEYSAVLKAMGKSER